MVPGVAGIVLDTNRPEGGPDGWLGGRQMAWLEQQLKRLNSRYFDADGTLHRTGVKDKLVFVFTHHPSTNIDRRGKATPRDGEDASPATVPRRLSNSCSGSPPWWRG